MKLVKGYLGSDLQMEGSLASKESIRIDATYIGSVLSEHSVIVGALGKVKGHIQSPVIKIDGWVEGDLNATKLVEVLGNAHIEGDIITPIGGLKMQIGGKFEGKLIMNSAK